MLILILGLLMVNHQVNWLTGLECRMIRQTIPFNRRLANLMRHPLISDYNYG